MHDSSSDNDNRPNSQPANDTLNVIEDDVKTLHSMGYAQELMRRMSGFSNFAISMSIICILAGCITSFQLAFCGAGPAGVGLGWPLGCLFALCVAATMAQVASAFPTSGGVYHWASILGGRGWGWIAAWCILFGLIIILSAVNVGAYNFVVAAFHFQEGDHPLIVRFAIVLAMTVTQAVLNHRGIRVTTILTDFSGYLILVVAVLLTGSLLLAADGFDFGRLVTFTNYSGAASGKVYEQPIASLPWLFLLGLLLPAYTVSGYDASANTSEETVGAAHTVPRMIIRSVLVSGIFGWIMLAAAVLAIPAMVRLGGGGAAGGSPVAEPVPGVDAAAAQGGNAFPWIMEQVLTQRLYLLLVVGIAVAQYLCSLATLTSASRMAYAFARDGGLPQWMREISPRFTTPAHAIWVTAAVAVAFTAIPQYDVISAACSIFIYIGYVIPAALGLFAYGRTWTKMGPWNMGGWYRVFAVLSMIGCLVIIAIGVAPPKQMNQWIVGGTLLVLLVAWFAVERRRFPGPPTGKTIEERQAAIAESERLSRILEKSQRESMH